MPEHLTDDIEKLYINGLQALESARILEKREVTIRCTALAWAVIVAHKIGDQRFGTYKSQFMDSVNGAGEIGGRQPLFFSPLFKTLKSASELRSEVETAIDL